MKEAQTALENYKKAAQTASTEISKAMESMEGNSWDRHWKIKQYNEEMAESAENASNRICAAYGAVSAALADLQGHTAVGVGGAAAMLIGLRGSYANGGINSSTGLAMLHGTQQKSEVIFNANDASKLYDLVHNTPNLIASMAQQSFQTMSKLPTVSNNSNTSSINVTIGQIVANNPQELTRNLDKTLDGYFRQKLTQSYVQ